MDLEHLLLSGSGRLSRRGFLGGIAALVVYAAATATIFRIPQGAFCAMNHEALMGRIYFAALGLLVLIGAVMLIAVGAKRFADMGWPEWLAVIPALGLVGAIVALRLPELGACGMPTPERLPVLAGAGGLLAVLLLLGLLWPGRRKPAPAQEPGESDEPTRVVGL